jgi:hypothetical protein
MTEKRINQGSRRGMDRSWARHDRSCQPGIDHGLKSTNHGKEETSPDTSSTLPNPKMTRTNPRTIPKFSRIIYGSI